MAEIINIAFVYCATPCTLVGRYQLPLSEQQKKRYCFAAANLLCVASDVSWQQSWGSRLL